MNKVILSVVLALGVGGAAIGVVATVGAGSNAAGSGLDGEITGLRQELDAARGEIRAMSDVIKGLRASQDQLAKDVRAAARSVSLASVAPAAGEDGRPVASAANLENVVSAVLQEEQRVRDEERTRQREELRQRMEERRKELAALGEGPYGRYNVKVNSLAKMLNLNDAQKQGYFDLSTAYREKLEEGMKQLREQRQNAEGQDANGEEGRRGRRGGFGRGGFSREGREQYRELASGIEEQFGAELQQILTPEQFETYGELSNDARSLSDRGEVRAPGDDTRTFGGRGGFTAGGGGRGGFGGGGRRGGGRGR